MEQLLFDNVKDIKILEFLQDFFGNTNFKIYPLAGDASTRKYFRVIYNENSWVLMSWSPFDINGYPFLSVLNHFQRSYVHVPQVITLSAKDGLILLEDLGDLTLERKFWESQNQESSIRFYESSIDELIKIHFHSTEDTNNNCTAFNIIFDTDKFLWEMNYALDNLIIGLCEFKLSDVLKNELSVVFKDICQQLDKEPKWIVHRDYHSRNLMIKLDKVFVIDFQDARMGPLQYDLVSLLKDSYVHLSEKNHQDLLESYLAKAKPYLKESFSKNHFMEIYNLQTLQRTFKACGSFSSFYIQRGDRRYLKHLTPTLKNIIKTLAEFPKYKPFLDLLIDSGALDIRYDAL